MVNIAKKLKYFQQQARMARQWLPPLPAPSCTTQSYQAYRGYGGCRRKREAGDDNQQAKIENLQEDYLANPTHETAMNLLNEKPWKGSTLVGPQQWIPYQAMLTASMIDEEELNDFATFLYCRLNQPDTDHPKDLFV